MSTIHLACAADEKYLPHCSAMLHSVLTHTRGIDVVVHFTHFPGFRRELLAGLDVFVRSLGARLHTTRVDQETIATLPSTEALPPVVWQRVLLPRLLPDVEKVLYLDSDLIAMTSVRELWDTDIRDYYLAAVTNPMHQEMADWPLKIGLPDAGSYFNSGVMLMNLSLLREKDCPEAIVRHAASHPELVHWGDQCAMNSVLHERRLALHPKWNVMNNFLTHGHGKALFSDVVLAEALADPLIIHFEGVPQSKPWHYRSEHPHRAIYLEHRQQTPWPLARLEGRTVANFVKKHLVPRRVLSSVRALRHRPDHS